MIPSDPKALLDMTIRELEMTKDQWELFHGQRHPGAGYTEVLKIQRKLLEKRLTLPR